MAALFHGMTTLIHHDSGNDLGMMTMLFRDFPH